MTDRIESMRVIDTVRDHVREHRDGMLADLVFAVVWVTAVEVLFDLLQGPRWAYYLCMFAGVIAYFGFFASLGAARNSR